MKIRVMNIENVKSIELSDFTKGVSDQLPLSSAFADCEVHVSILSYGKSDYIAQINLVSKGMHSVNDGFSENLLDGRINKDMTVDWKATDKDRKPEKAYQAVIKAGKEATRKYLASPYNHFKKHFKKVPLIKTDANDDFVDTYTLA